MLFAFGHISLALGLILQHLFTKSTLTADIHIDQYAKPGTNEGEINQPVKPLVADQVENAEGHSADSCYHPCPLQYLQKFHIARFDQAKVMLSGGLYQRISVTEPLLVMVWPSAKVIETV